MTIWDEKINPEKRVCGRCKAVTLCQRMKTKNGMRWVCSDCRRELFIGFMVEGLEGGISD